jgi:hypothetical protein
VCQPPSCTSQCDALTNPTNCDCNVSCDPVVAEIHCPDDLCQLEHCPACSVDPQQPVCNVQCTQIDPHGPTCTPPSASCTPNCQPARCAWKCEKPTDCTEPTCNLECESPRINVCKGRP